jgi:predicted RNA-binding protein with PUA domain
VDHPGGAVERFTVIIVPWFVELQRESVAIIPYVLRNPCPDRALDAVRPVVVDGKEVRLLRFDGDQLRWRNWKVRDEQN